jgi:hypothetical protein
VSTNHFSADQTVAAGDPFICAGERKSEPPCACNSGLVSIGIEEDGQTFIELVPCKRCRPDLTLSEEG